MARNSRKRNADIDIQRGAHAAPSGRHAAASSTQSDDDRGTAVTDGRDQRVSTKSVHASKHAIARHARDVELGREATAQQLFPEYVKGRRRKCLAKRILAVVLSILLVFAVYSIPWNPVFLNRINRIVLFSFYRPAAIGTGFPHPLRQ